MFYLSAFYYRIADMAQSASTAVTEKNRKGNRRRGLFRRFAVLYFEREARIILKNPFLKYFYLFTIAYKYEDYVKGE